MDVVTGGMHSRGVTMPGVGLWAHIGLCPRISLFLCPLGLGWVEDEEGPLHLQVVAPQRATHTCILPHSAPSALHHPGSLPSQLRALGMGYLGTKVLSSAGLPSPRDTGDQSLWQSSLPLSCSASSPSSNWPPWFSPMGLQTLLKPRGFWGCKTLT